MRLCAAKRVKIAVNRSLFGGFQRYTATGTKIACRMA
jgi:hypothetical protein